MCYQEAVNAIKTTGLDPALGCLHEPFYSRDSLACDLLEPLRPLIDAWVYQLFHQSVVRKEDFTTSADGCLMQAAGKQRFYEAFRQKAPAFRCLRRVHRLIRDWGIPIQFSVFELEVKASQLEQLMKELTMLINVDEDKVMFYRLSPEQDRICLGVSVQTEDLLFV